MDSNSFNKIFNVKTEYSQNKKCFKERIFLNFCLKLFIIASEEQRNKLKLLTRFSE